MTTIERLREAVAAVTQRVGCGDNSCRWARPTGMATNGGCLCRDGSPGNGYDPNLAARMAALYRVARELIEEPDWYVDGPTRPGETP